jgi:hypothetical protein
MEATGIKTYLNYQIEDLDGEEWVDILGYDGLYLISNMGRVKSCQREVSMCGRGNRIKPEKIMKQQVTRSNFNNIKEPSKDLKVSFCVDKIKKTYHVTTLVGNAFLRELKENEVYSKKDKVWNNNNADNLIILKKTDDIKLSYQKGNNLRKKNHLILNHKNLFIYTRLSDNKEFIGTELIAEYKSQVRSNIKKAIANNRMAYGSKWVRRPV